MRKKEEETRITAFSIYTDLLLLLLLLLFSCQNLC